jgi:hypothetical protein
LYSTIVSLKKIVIVSSYYYTVVLTMNGMLKIRHVKVLWYSVEKWVDKFDGTTTWGRGGGIYTS